jgi:hypothetical protein
MGEYTNSPNVLVLHDYRPAVLGKDVIDLRLTWAPNESTSGWRLDVTSTDGITTVHAAPKMSRFWNRPRLDNDERRQLILDLLTQLSARHRSEPYMIYRPEILFRAVEDIAVRRAA